MMIARARPVVWGFFGVIALWLLALVGERQGVIDPVDSLALDVLNPVQTLTVGALRPIQHFATGVTRGSDLARENEEQKRRIALLESEVARLREYAFENQELRRDLQFKNRHPDLELIRARVISEDPSNYIGALQIDQGRAAGVEPGMVAVSGDGLLGKVVSATNNAAKIVLSVDPSTSIYAVVQREGARASGVVEGAGQGRMTMKFVSQSADLRPGDVVVTSGRGGTYPGGIVVGEVIEVQRNDVAPFQQAELRPAVDPRHLESVLIVANFLPTTAGE
ncbi:MAG TPA: rod shape-determining protein MreC [Dehalococcoidia bacterium]|nr:rod shape-determining protein MreC [Dehalococcoidia bacterium]